MVPLKTLLIFCVSTFGARLIQRSNWGAGVWVGAQVDPLGVIRELGWGYLYI